MRGGACCHQRRRPVQPTFEEDSASITIGAETGFIFEVEINGQSYSAPGTFNIDTLVAFGASWSYLDDGTDQGTAWRAPGFDDSSRPSLQRPLAAANSIA